MHPASATGSQTPSGADVLSEATPGWKAGLVPVFEAALELEYREDRLSRYLRVIRLSVGVAVVLYVSYLVFDYLSFGRLVNPWIYGMILGISTPMIGLVILAASLDRLRRHLHRILIAALICNGIALTVSVALAQVQSGEMLSEILIMHMIYNFFLLGLLFRFTLPFAVFELALFAAISLALGTAPLDLLDKAYFFAATIILCGIASRLAEVGDRVQWLQARQLRHLSERDSLTGLYNRRLFFERVTDALRLARREGRSVALLLVDADHFKQLNDRHGHAAGDTALRMIAQHLGQAARRPLDSAARLGGEEFALFIYNTAPAWALRRAQEICEAIAATPMTATVPLRVTVSIGKAWAAPPGIPEVEELLSSADAALYRAKGSGRNRVME